MCSAAVIRGSGMAPAGTSTPRSSMAYPAPRSTTSRDKMSAPTDPSATASEPRLPGRSSSWTRSRYEGTRNTVAQHQRLSIPGDERLCEEQTAEDERLREERTAGMALHHAVTRLASRADLPRRGSPPGAPRAPGADRRRAQQLCRPVG